MKRKIHFFEPSHGAAVKEREEEEKDRAEFGKQIEDAEERQNPNPQTPNSKPQTTAKQQKQNPREGRDSPALLRFRVFDCLPVKSSSDGFPAALADRDPHDKPASEQPHDRRLRNHLHHPKHV